MSFCPVTSIALAREDILLGPIDALLAGAGLTVQSALRVAAQGRQGGVRASQLEVLAAEVALIARPGLGTSRSKWPHTHPAMFFSWSFLDAVLSPNSHWHSSDSIFEPLNISSHSGHRSG